MILDLPYQDVGARWLASQRRAGLADEQGVGKSVQAVKACELIGARRVAVIGPAKMRATWEWEFSDKAPSPSRRLRVLSYESATDLFKSLAPGAPLPDVLVIDEAHYLKNWQSGRTQAIYPRVQQIPFVWPLTGTPIPNGKVHPNGELSGRVDELWTHFYYLRHDLINFMSPAQFINEFALTKKAFGERKVIGVKPDKEPHLRSLFQQLWLRRMLADVAPDLPPMRESEIILDLKVPADVERLSREKAGMLTLDPDILPTGDEELATLRRLLAEAKAPALADFVAEELRNNPDEKIVIFAWHTNPIDDIADRLQSFGVVKVDGRTPPAHVQAHVDAFQNDPRYRVFLGQIRAAGTGLTLTAASNVIFLECSWVPADNEQAQRRILRIGQKAASVLCRYVVLKGSIDEAVTRVLARKTRGINRIVQ